jgi:demethylmenaquinone methyltransferase/2-methoxy-6-polyprenyl-1,4-benzoquinol methylase
LIVSILPRPEEKAAYVQQSFAAIAAGYDRTNRVMTLGMDRQWRDYATEVVAPPANGRALDVGTGTGDFLPLLAAWMPGGVAVGIDFCLPMMQEGWNKLDALHGEQPTVSHEPPIPAGRTAFVAGDALCLPFPDQSFDAITTGFVMRNVTDIAASLREMWRVARPGGVMACLEVARPPNPLLRLGHRLYFEKIVPLIGGAINHNRRFYTYLPHSARAFPTPDTLARMMREAGWQHVHYTLHGMGAVAIHRGTRL